MNEVQLGFALARERLRGLAALVSLLIGATVFFALGVLARRVDSSSAADGVLACVFGFALPICAYLVSGRVCDGERLDRGLDAVARYGTSRRQALLGVLLGSALFIAAATALFTLAGLLGAHSPGAAGFASELRASLGIALLSGMVYAVWFGAASAFGKRGGGRKWALIGDFVLGAGGSALAAPFPRAHVRNLLGGEPVLGSAQSSAWLALIAIGVLCVALGMTRTAD